MRFASRSLQPDLKEVAYRDALSNVSLREPRKRPASRHILLVPVNPSVSVQNSSQLQNPNPHPPHPVSIATIWTFQRFCAIADKRKSVGPPKIDRDTATLRPYLC